MSWFGPFNSFPREMGFPTRNGIVYDLREFIEKINKYNGLCTVFTSLYSFNYIKSNGKPDYSSAKVEHIFIDLDNGNSLESVRKLHKHLTEKKLRHAMFFSGGGFHIYIAVHCPKTLKNKKSAIFNAVVDLADNIGLKIGINEDADIDAHAVGNLAQLVRVPNTYNLKRKRFCIPLTELDLTLNLEQIKNMAKKQRLLVEVYGEYYLGLTPYDREPTIKIDFPLGNFKGEAGLENIDVENFPPCIKYLLNRRPLRHRERYIIIVYCKEIGLPLKDSIMLLRKYLPARTFRHCVREERQPVWVYRRGDLSFPSCRKLQEEGNCPKVDCGMRK